VKHEISIAAPRGVVSMVWGTTAGRPSWLDQLERDDEALAQLVVLRTLDTTTWLAAASALSRSTRLKSLTVHRELSADVLAALAQAISTSRLESVSIGTHALGDTGAAMLLPALAQCATLVSCDLEFRGIGDTSADAIGALLASATSVVRVLNLARNEGLTEVGLGQIVSAVATSRLAHLDLGGITVGDAGGRALGRMLCEAECMESLKLKAVRLDGAAAAEFADAVDRPARRLHSLDLSDADLGDGAASVLRMLASRAPALASLTLDRAVMPADARGALADLVSLPLRTLHLHEIALGDAHASTLAVALGACCPPLESLHIGGNELSAGPFELLLGACAQLRTMRSFDCIGNPLGDAGAKALARLLAADERGLLGSLTSLSVSACGISLGGFAVVERVLCAQAVPVDPPAARATLALECAQNPACMEDGWEPLVARLRAARPEFQLIFKALGTDAEPAGARAVSPSS
jgi:hypothetical protein